MRAKQRIKLIDGATAATTSAVIRNEGSDVMAFQVGGTFTDVELTVQGRTYPDADFVGIAVIDLSSFAVTASGEITAAGIYEIGTETLYEIQVVVTSVTGGTVDVILTATNSVEA